MRSEARRARPTSWRPPPTAPRQGASVASPASRTRSAASHGGASLIWSSTTHGWRDHRIAMAPGGWRALDERLVHIAYGPPHDSSAIHDEVIAALDAAGPSAPRLEALRVLATEAGEALRTGDLVRIRASAHGGDRGPDGAPPGARVRRRAGAHRTAPERRRRSAGRSTAPAGRAARSASSAATRATVSGSVPKRAASGTSRSTCTSRQWEPRRGSATGEGGRPPLEEGSHALGVVLGGEALLEGARVRRRCADPLARHRVVDEPLGAPRRRTGRRRGSARLPPAPPRRGRRAAPPATRTRSARPRVASISSPESSSRSAAVGPTSRGSRKLPGPGVGHQAPLHEHPTEPRPVGRDPHVALRGELRAHAHRRAVHRRDDGLRAARQGPASDAAGRRSSPRSLARPPASRRAPPGRSPRRTRHRRP